MKAKISMLAFPVYASILMCSNNNSWQTTKSVGSFEKDYKIPLYPSKIPWLFGFHMYAIVKTQVMCRKVSLTHPSHSRHIFDGEIAGVCTETLQGPYSIFSFRNFIQGRAAET